MTEIDGDWRKSVRLKPMDEYHPFSLDWDENWEIVRLRDNSWVARKIPEGQARFGDERNPQTGCG